MEKKIIIFCSTTTLALIAIIGLVMLFNAAFSPKDAMASSTVSSYSHADVLKYETTGSKNALAVVQPVPEPATICMLAFGGATLVTQRNRKNRKHKSKKLNSIQN